MSIENPEAKDLLELSIINMKSAIASFYSNPSPSEILATATQVWTDVNSSAELKNKVDQTIRIRSRLLYESSTSSTSDENPIRRRYNPYKWLKKVPTVYGDRVGDYVLDMSKTLLEFLEGLS